MFGQKKKKTLICGVRQSLEAHPHSKIGLTASTHIAAEQWGNGGGGGANGGNRGDEGPGAASRAGRPQNKIYEPTFDDGLLKRSQKKKKKSDTRTYHGKVYEVRIADRYAKKVSSVQARSMACPSDVASGGFLALEIVQLSVFTKSHA